MSSYEKLKQITEAALLAAGSPLTLDGILELFLEEERPEKAQLREVLKELQEDYQDRGIEVAEVGGAFRINVRAEYAPWVSRLWEERPARYSRALMETLALIAYRQPITRGEIEDIRGVSVSTSIVKTLMEREWVRIVGQRDVPGKPSLYATTREFLNYFSLSGLGDLPTLQEIRDFDSINRELKLEDPGSDVTESSQDETGSPETLVPDEMVSQPETTDTERDENVPDLSSEAQLNEDPGAISPPANEAETEIEATEEDPGSDVSESSQDETVVPDEMVSQRETTDTERDENDSDLSSEAQSNDAPAALSPPDSDAETETSEEEPGESIRD